MGEKLLFIGHAPHFIALQGNVCLPEEPASRNKTITAGIDEGQSGGDQVKK